MEHTRDLVTLEQAAKVLRLSLPTLRRLLQKTTIELHSIHRAQQLHIAITIADLVRLAQSPRELMHEIVDRRNRIAPVKSGSNGTPRQKSLWQEVRELELARDQAELSTTLKQLELKDVYEQLELATEQLSRSQGCESGVRVDANADPGARARILPPEPSRDEPSGGSTARVRFLLSDGSATPTSADIVLGISFLDHGEPLFLFGRDKRGRVGGKILEWGAGESLEVHLPRARPLRLRWSLRSREERRIRFVDIPGATKRLEVEDGDGVQECTLSVPARALEKVVQQFASA